MTDMTGRALARLEALRGALCDRRATWPNGNPPPGLSSGLSLGEVDILADAADALCRLVEAMDRYSETGNRSFDDVFTRSRQPRAAESLAEHLRADDDCRAAKLAADAAIRRLAGEGVEDG